MSSAEAIHPHVWIAGGSGLLGSRLVAHLSGAGYRVTADAYRSLSSEMAVDLRDPEATHRLLDRVQPDIIVNLVACTDVDACEVDVDLAYKLNIRPVENIAHWIERNPRSRLIQVSTDHVYDGAGIHLESDIRLVNVYAMTKYAAEIAASHIGATILRTNFFGKSIHKTRRTLSDWMLQNLRDQAGMSVFTDVEFTPLNLSTLVRAVERVIQVSLPGTFNLGSRDGFSKAEFCLELARAFKLPVDRVTPVDSGTLKQRARRPTQMRMDSTAFEKAFDFPLPTLKAEISQLRKDYE